jgi:hypothetical protein
MIGQPVRLWVVKSKRRGGFPRRAPILALAGPGAESALCEALNRLSGRSQRGDSAWKKTLDHLLSLVYGDLNIDGESIDVKGNAGGPRAPSRRLSVDFRRYLAGSGVRRITVEAAGPA